MKIIPILSRNLSKMSILVFCAVVPFFPAFAESSPEDKYVFDSTVGVFPGNTGRWYNYIQSEEECTGGSGFSTNRISPTSCFNWLSSKEALGSNWIISKIPWWINSNHQMLPGRIGIEFVNVIAFAQVPDASIGKVSIKKTTVEFDAIAEDLKMVTADSREGKQRSHIYFWFQSAPESEQLRHKCPNR